ncbi:MAG: hypothetical protein GY832_26765 [Chloroflexi bacterium]|nr:hypothetical protein [Chloroflexota bacterium]
MVQHEPIALNASNVTKKFVKKEGFRWPWKKQEQNGNGSTNSNGRKMVVAVNDVGFEVRRGEVFRRAEKYAKLTGKLSRSG